MTLQIVKGLITLYGEAGDKAKDLIVEEFEEGADPIFGKRLGSWVAHNRRLPDDSDSETISLFDRLPDWKSKLSIRMVAGFAEKK